MKLESLNLYALKYFFDTVETKSLSQAAQMNFVTRSAISQALVRLETWAGRKLLTHERKVFRLTREGEDFYRQMRTSYEQFQNSVMSAERSGTNVLRIGCSASLMDTILFPAFKKFPSRPSLHLLTGTSSALERKWEDGEVNLAIFIGEKPHHTNHVRIKSGEFVLASPSGRIEGQIITTETRSEVRELHRALEKNRLREITFSRVESWSLAARLALELKCTCLIPDILTGKLRKIPLRGFHAPYAVWVLHKNREQLSEQELRLLDHFHKV